MCYSPLGRRTVAITAAYALALHALLAAFVAPQAAASAPVSVVCFGAGSADDQDSGLPEGLPPSHDPACVVCALAPPVDAAIRVAVTVERASLAVDARPRRGACSGPARARAQSPRAPPVIT
jgi:hypothetical protein